MGYDPKLGVDDMLAYKELGMCKADVARDTGLSRGALGRLEKHTGVKLPPHEPRFPFEDEIQDMRVPEALEYMVELHKELLRGRLDTPDQVAQECVEYGFTRSESLLWRELRYSRGPRRQTNLHAQLYAHDPNGGPDVKIIDVFVCKIREKLKRARSRWMIVTRWGIGYEVMER